MSTNGAVKSATDVISDKAPKIVRGTGKVTKASLVKLGLASPEASPEKSFFRKPKFYIPASTVGIVAAFAWILRSLFHPKSS